MSWAKLLWPAGIRAPRGVRCDGSLAAGDPITPDGITELNRNRPTMHGPATLRAFAADRRAVVGMIIALFAVPMLALAGVAIDMGNFLAVKAQLRNAADSAALAAVVNIGDSSEATSNAISVAELNMPPDKHGTVLNAGDIVIGTWDADARTFSGGGSSPNAVQVTVRRTAGNGNAIELFFSAILGIDTVDATEIAVAIGAAGGTACVLALSGSGSGAIDVSGNAEVDFNGCDLAANSGDADALEVSANARLTADCARLVGSTDAASPEFETECGGAVTGAPTTADPYAGLPSPTIGPCIETDFRNTNGDGTTTLSAGTYCGNFSVTGGTVRLNPGTYVIDGGDLSVNGGATLEEVAGGTGVTIILTDSSVSDSPGAVTINGGANVTLAAPTSGTYSGVVFYQEPGSGAPKTSKFNGGSTTNLTGALYLPNGDIEFTGGNEVGGSTCTQIVALTIKFTGNSVLNSDCEDKGTTDIEIIGSSLLVL